MTAAISGGCGDVVYSIPIMRQLCVTKYFVKKNFYLYSNLFDTCKGLLNNEGFEVESTSGDYELYKFNPAIKFDINIDEFRYQQHRGTTHIMTRMAKQFKTKQYDWNIPWLNVEPAKHYDNLIHLTSRWREKSKVDWRIVLSHIKGSVAFLGFQHEWVDFCLQYGDVPWLPTNDILEMARYIAGAERLYCNQSVALTLAQGLGKEYWLEKKPNKLTTVMGTKNENIL